MPKNYSMEINNLARINKSIQRYFVDNFWFVHKIYNVENL